MELAVLRFKPTGQTYKVLTAGRDAFPEYGCFTRKCVLMRDYAREEIEDAKKE